MVNSEITFCSLRMSSLKNMLVFDAKHHKGDPAQHSKQNTNPLRGPKVELVLEASQRWLKSKMTESSARR